MVANVVADLLQAAQGGEVADGVSENGVTFERKAGGEAGHVLLGDADIEKLAREARDVLVEDGEAQVAGQQENFRVLGASSVRARMKASLMVGLQLGERRIEFRSARYAVVPEHGVFHEADAFALDGMGDKAGGLAGRERHGRQSRAQRLVVVPVDFAHGPAEAPSTFRRTARAP